MITGLYLHNFKAFDELSLPLRPITVILGPNNSGKSSILAAVRLLVQTVESFDPDVPLLLTGIMGDLGTFKDVVFGNHRGRPFKIGFSVHPNEYRISRLEIKPGANLAESWKSIEDDSTLELMLAYKYRARRRELILDSSELKQHRKNNQTHIILSTEYSEDSERQTINIINGKQVPPNLKGSLSKYLRMRNFIPSFNAYIEKESQIAEFLEQTSRGVILGLSSLTRSLVRALEKTEYIGAMRIPPLRRYAYTGERRRRVGASGENAANILAMDKARMGSRSNRITEAVSAWLFKSTIASDFKISPTSDSFYEILVQHPETKEYENLADVGLGNSQILPILVGGYNLTAGSTYLVEEPEIHLHPRAQAELGSFFLDLYNTGVQSVIETHSEHLILRLQQYVANNQISQKDVQFYFIQAEQGRKVAKSLTLDQMGMFTSEWPGGFFPERLQEAKNLARIRAKNSIDEEK
jgi:predicted ATPase